MRRLAMGIFAFEVAWLRVCDWAIAAESLEAADLMSIALA